MRACTNPACGMKDRSVETDRASCMACGRPLENPLGGLFGNLLGDLGKITGTGPAVPAEVLEALRAATGLLESFDAGEPVKRKMIQHTLEKCRSALGRFG